MHYGVSYKNMHRNEYVMTRKYTNWLREEMIEWVDDKLIEKSQADAILARYPVVETTDLVRLVISAIGGVLIGLSVILFFAYNWQDMHRLLKLSVIILTLGLCHFGSIWFYDKHRNTSEGLSVLSTVIFGGAIWLISQAYHIDGHYPNFFLLWGSGALAMAWARPSELQGFAALLLLAAWAVLEVLVFERIFYSASWLVLIGVGLLGFRLLSPWLVFSACCIFCFISIANLREPLGDLLGYGIFVLSITCICVGLFFSRLSQLCEFRHAVSAPGFSIYLFIVFFLTFAHFSNDVKYLILFDVTTQSMFFWGSILVMLCLFGSLFLPCRSLRESIETDKLHVVLLVVSTVILFNIGMGGIEFSYGILSGMMNLIFIGHCLLFILHGSQFQRGWEVGIGCLLFSSLIFARYIDLFDSLLSRASVFLVLGVVLFVVGNFYSRQKINQQKYAKQKINSEENIVSDKHAVLLDKDISQ